TIASTSSPRRRSSSVRRGSTNSSTSPSASVKGTRSGARSPWMPTPSSTSSSPRVNWGSSSPGWVPADSARLMVRAREAARRPMSATSSRLAPASAAAPHNFSTITVAAVPRRPGPASSPVAVAAAAAGGGAPCRAGPGLGGGPAQLLDGHGGGGAAAAGPGLVTGVGGQIVVDQHHLGGDLVVAADLAGDAEVQHVAGVVLDDLD